jgi:hypothetical protein
VTWFKVGDTFPFDPRIVAAGNAAAGLWTRAGAWSAWQLSDGFVPDLVLKTMGKPSEIRALIEAGLWHKEAGGIRFDDWFTDQPSAADVRDKQAKRAEAGRRGGRSSGVTRRSKREANAEANASRLLRTETNPVPSRPVEEKTPSSPPLPPADAGGDQARQLALVPETKQATTRKRASKMTPDWEPSERSRQLLKDRYPDFDWRQAESIGQFRDYWLGRGETRADWDATWRNRMADYAEGRLRSTAAVTRGAYGARQHTPYRDPDPLIPGAFPERF